MEIPTPDPLPTELTPSSRSTLSLTQVLLFATLAVGTLDILDALIFYYFEGVQPIRIFQSIASGVLGRASYEGGLASAALGGVLHYTIAFCIVAIYVATSRRLAFLNRHPWLSGMVYGLIVYHGMQWIVIPLSAFPGSGAAPPLDVVINGWIIHMLGVGLPCAFFARKVADH